MSTPSRFTLLGLSLAATALSALLPAPATAGGLSSACDGIVLGARVCGQIQGSGETYGQSFGPAINYATFTVAGTPLQSGPAPVSLSGAVAGVGLFGGVAASGSFGQVHVFASAQDQNPHNDVDVSHMLTQGNVSFADAFTVGSQNVEALFDVGADGGFGGFGEGTIHFQLDDVTPYQSGALVPDFSTTLAAGRSSFSQTFDFVLSAGHSYELFYELEADAIAYEDFLTNIPVALADMSHTGTLNIDVVTPGQSLTFASGHDYRTDADTGPTTPPTPPGAGSSTVPEPSVSLLLAIGLAGFGFTRRVGLTSARQMA